MSTMLLLQIGVIAGLGAVWSIFALKQRQRMRPRRIARSGELTGRR